MAASTDQRTFELILESLDEPWACEANHNETVAHHAGPAKYLINVPGCTHCTSTLICATLHDAIVALDGAHSSSCSHALSEITFTTI